MMGGGSSGGEFESSDSRKRRRLSERRRVFSRIGVSNEHRQQQTHNPHSGSLSTDQSWSSSSQVAHNNHGTLDDQLSRSESPLGGDRISMKIQFHIVVAPDHEPLVLDSPPIIGGGGGSSSGQGARVAAANNNNNRQSRKSIESIGDQIHERLARQNTLSTRRRQQLLALHNQSALDNAAAAAAAAGGGLKGRKEEEPFQSEDNITARSMSEQLGPSGSRLGPAWAATEGGSGGRESGARSSTITGGMSDEDTIKFLARHQARPVASSPPLTLPVGSASSSSSQLRQPDRELIYFKRDGQRFGHEFTLKLAVDRTYRCLLKVRPLIPLQGITIQGHPVLFVDCSQRSGASIVPLGGPASAPNSSLGLNRSWQNIQTNASISSNTDHHHYHHHQNHRNPQPKGHTLNSHHHHQQQQPTHHRLQHAQTTTGLSRAALTSSDGPLMRNSLYQQQQSQMMRHFAASHCSSSNSHLGSQLIYMFDWSAARFEVNKNKARTQVQTVLKFKNGQILSLPMQVKFYQSECRQHLSWGSQLHFIDYDCQINNMGQISVDRVQYY